MAIVAEKNLKLLHPNSNQKLENAKNSFGENSDEIFRNNKISKSEIIKAYQYKDKLGFHYTFIAKKVQIYKNLPHEMEDSQDIELLHNLLLNSETKITIKNANYDLVNDCPLDFLSVLFKLQMLIKIIFLSLDFIQIRLQRRCRSFRHENYNV